MHEDQRLKTVVQLIVSYRFQKPLSLFLRETFRSHRSMGATDRRIISQCIYSFYRLGKSFELLSIPHRVSIGLFLTADKPDDFYLWCISNYSSLNTDAIEADFKDKIKQVEFAYPEFSEKNIFPYGEFLSNEINTEEFAYSFLSKPKTWIRVRKEFHYEVLAELEKKHVMYNMIAGTNAIEVLSAFRLDDLQSYRNGYFEIQDFNSQQTGNHFEPKPESQWWDACAGSGGKSLLLFEKENSIKLTVSDKRENILFNLSERFKRSGLRNYKTAIVNLKKQSLSSKEMFDGIIVDAPCTGSGTWARSPEWLSFFNSELINDYSEKQRLIVANVMKNLRKSSPLIYITCSVFKKENEENVNYFTENFNLTFESSTYLKGYEKGADTLFVARTVRK